MVCLKLQDINVAHRHLWASNPEHLILVEEGSPSCLGGVGCEGE